MRLVTHGCRHLTRDGDTVSDADVSELEDSCLNCLYAQWAIALKEAGQHKSSIVVLADVPKCDLDQMVNEIRRQTGMDVMGREGRPYNLADLEMVSASNAKTIILMDPLQDQGWVRTPRYTFCSLVFFVPAVCVTHSVSLQWVVSDRLCADRSVHHLTRRGISSGQVTGASVLRMLCWRDGAQCATACEPMPCTCDFGGLVPHLGCLVGWHMACYSR